jgi:glucose/arabinose dehydrogenase
MLDNQIPGRPPNDKSVVLRVDKSTGMAVQDNDNPFYNNLAEGNMTKKLQRYFGYGIRNSFGLDFDPISRSLWMTENGPDKYDEINIVKPGFNSGWHKVMGPIARANMTAENDLITFNRTGNYQDPVFSWYIPIGITDIAFLNSTKLGDKYANNIFVGDINNGNLYFFTINKDRDGVVHDNIGLEDQVADNPSEVSKVMFARGFSGGITDIESGPDGYLYILTYEGSVYRISPMNKVKDVAISDLE